MVMKKKPIKKKMMAGGRTKGTKYKAAGGGKLKMVMKDGKKVPFFAADGKGKMKKGGKAKLMGGGMTKGTKYKAAGGRTMKTSKYRAGGGIKGTKYKRRGGKVK